MSSTLTLFRQDPARGGLLRAIGSSLVVGLLMRVPTVLGKDISELAADDLPGGFAPMYLVSTAFVVTLVLGANAWTRSSRLALGLPLSTRRVWTVRTASLIGVGLVSVSALAVTMGLSVDLATKHVTMNPLIALAAARAAVTVVLMLFVFQLPQSERDRIPVDAPYVVYVIFSGFIILVLSAVAIPSIAGTMVLLMLALALGVWLFLRLPSTFSIGPTVAESQAQMWTHTDDVATDHIKPRWEKTSTGDRDHPVLGLHWVIFRGLGTHLLRWILLLIVVASAAVVTAEFFKGTNAFLPLFFLLIYHLPLLQSALEGMKPYDPLPISRRVLWLHAVGPIIVSAAFGAGIALTVFMLNPRPFTQVQFNGCCVEVPWEYLELSRDGRTQTVTAPWGESFTPRARPLWRGRAMSLYDPYEVGPESSPRFVEYQMRRAVNAVYGIPLPAELSSPDDETPPNIAGGVERSAFNLDVTRGRLSEDRNRTAAVALLLLMLGATVLMFTALLQFGSSVHRKVFKWVALGFIIFLVVIAIAVSAARLLEFTEVWYVGAPISIGVHTLALWLPLPTTALWVLCIMCWTGSYLVLERVFSTIEFPREKTMNRFAEEY